MPQRKWETVVSLPRWTKEAERAASKAGMEVAPHDGYVNRATTVGLVLDADSAEDAMRLIRHALEPYGLCPEVRDFRGPFPSSAPTP